MTIINQEKYNQHLDARNGEKHSLIYELLLPMLLFGSIGAIAWAIRGSSGWGGVDGTVLPGLMWGVLWYYMAYRKGIDARGIVFWLGFGLSLGGELGYGPYVSWIRGNFHIGDGIIAIEPWFGYVWFILCGIGWAAPGGILLGWALGERVSVNKWIIRAVLFVSFLVIMFAWPFMEWLSEMFVQLAPGLLFPKAELGIYAAELDKQLSRTVYTNTQNFLAVVWWIIALLVALWQRDRITLITGLIIGGGFGLGFMLSALWALGYDFAPGYIDWWKVWELNSGLNLGLLYAVAFYWALRNVDKTIKSNKTITDKTEVRTKYLEWRDTLLLAFGGFVLLYFVGFEYFFWTGLALSLFYFIAMSLTAIGDLDSQMIAERRKNVSLIYSIFFLVFLMFHGGSEQLGIVLELYEVDQYNWPAMRILFFVPVAIVIVIVALSKMRKVLQSNNLSKDEGIFKSKHFLWIVDLMTVMGFIGVLSIWPAKISIFYALFLVLAIFAFNRLEHRFNSIDTFKK